VCPLCHVFVVNPRPPNYILFVPLIGHYPPTPSFSHSHLRKFEGLPSSPSSTSPFPKHLPGSVLSYFRFFPFSMFGITCMFFGGDLYVPLPPFHWSRTGSPSSQSQDILVGATPLLSTLLFVAMSLVLRCCVFPPHSLPILHC